MRALFTLGLLFFCTVTQAHQLSTAYFQGNINNVGVLQGELQVRLYDLDQILALDEDANGKLLWKELRARENDINAYLGSHLMITRGDKPCTLVFSSPWAIDKHFNESYLALPVRAQCALVGSLNIHYDAFMSEDSQHKLLVSFKADTGASENRVISNSQQSVVINAEAGDAFISFKEFAFQGMVHIWQGTDHILFLCSLLLGCVLSRHDGRWTGKAQIRNIIVDATWIVTAFTLAHSITLSATALNILHFPSRWAEVGIALSVAFTAINNIFPMVFRLGLLTFCFGLLHGMGFAGALGELGIPADQQLLTVLAFNLGVEIGQLAIVLVVLPLLIAVRNKAWYARFGMTSISIVIALIAAYWVVQRVTAF